MKVIRLGVKILATKSWDCHLHAFYHIFWFFTCTNGIFSSHPLHKSSAGPHNWFTGIIAALINFYISFLLYVRSKIIDWTQLFCACAVFDGKYITCFEAASYCKCATVLKSFHITLAKLYIVFPTSSHGIIGRNCRVHCLTSTFKVHTHVPCRSLGQFHILNFACQNFCIVWFNIQAFCSCSYSWGVKWGCWFLLKTHRFLLFQPSFQLWVSEPVQQYHLLPLCWFKYNFMVTTDTTGGGPGWIQSAWMTVVTNFCQNRKKHVFWPDFTPSSLSWFAPNLTRC